MTTKAELSELDFLKMADTLNQSEQYRVITKYNKPEFYNLCVDVPKKIGVFLDIEATGLSFTEDKLIELGMVKFEYSDDGRRKCNTLLVKLHFSSQIKPYVPNVDSIPYYV